MSELLWLRAESKDMEARSALGPTQVSALLEAGFEVAVEQSSQRAISDKMFANTGCLMVEEGSWVDAPAQAWILGLKELPESNAPLTHRHIYFAHAYKEQPGWQDILGRFKRGGGELFDLEYLNDADGRRVAAFGFWAGFTGCAVGLRMWAGEQLGYVPIVPALSSYSSKNALLDELNGNLDEAIRAAQRKPGIIVIGAGGRVGAGAIELANALGLELTEWDMKETASGGPFAEILEHDVFVNCVLMQKKIPPFITEKNNTGRKQKTVRDLRCELRPGPA